MSEATQQWQPIETAPKDGMHMLLLYRPKAASWAMVAPGYLNKNQNAAKPRPFWELCLHIGSRTEARMWEPTHWMPLPEPPKDAS